MYSRYFLSSTAVLLRPVLLRPEAAHENEHRGKMEKKRIATVFDIVSKHWRIVHDSIRIVGSCIRPPTICMKTNTPKSGSRLLLVIKKSTLSYRRSSRSRAKEGLAPKATDIGRGARRRPTPSAESAHAMRPAQGCLSSRWRTGWCSGQIKIQGNAHPAETSCR